MAPSAPGSNGRRNSTRGSTRNTTTVKKEINNSTSSLKLDLHSNPETSDSDDRRSESLLPVRTRGRGRGRGRPPRRAALVASSRSSKLAQPVIESELESDQESNDDEAEEDQGEDSASQKGKGGEEDNEGTLEESGEAKITKDGELLGGREFKCRSFKLPDRGNRVYMLSMDPARVLGFRDSYLFFLKNPQLVRVITTVDERQWMIENGILMANFKSKAIAVVTARSIFKLFGSKIIKGGRARVDDYFENSVEDGEDSDASSLTGSGNTAPGSTTGGHTEEGTPVATSMKRKYRATAQEERTTHVTDLNWQYESAMAVRTLNSQLRDLRKENSKFLDPHTNTEHGPSFLQPSRCEVREVSKRAKLLGSSKGFVSIPSSIGPKTDETVRVEVRAAAPTPPYINDPSIWAVIPQEIQKSLQAAEQMRNEQAPEDDEDLTRYPISILSGQYQAAYPM
ncbi:hypothetical protein BGZ83_004793 [Gryganskiella cystojenkinii]|nr:hypothetical protein BGZ83_004793 [Gryganskiella cystojenkinii]